MEKEGGEEAGDGGTEGYGIREGGSREKDGLKARMEQRWGSIYFLPYL